MFISSNSFTHLNQREVGFLKEKRRLNVAMTRPRKQLVSQSYTDPISN
jgi:superfamily I DNA and/or RNA helicase